MKPAWTIPRFAVIILTASALIAATFAIATNAVAGETECEDRIRTEPQADWVATLLASHDDDARKACNDMRAFFGLDLLPTPPPSSTTTTTTAPPSPLPPEPEPATPSTASPSSSLAEDDKALVKRWEGIERTFDNCLTRLEIAPHLLETEAERLASEQLAGTETDDIYSICEVAHGDKPNEAEEEARRQEELRTKFNDGYLFDFHHGKSYGYGDTYGVGSVRLQGTYDAADWNINYECYRQPHRNNQAYRGSIYRSRLAGSVSTLEDYKTAFAAICRPLI